MDIKKLFTGKKASKGGLLDFLDKKGFYIILILCIAIVGVTAVFVTTRNATLSNEDYNAEKMIPEEFANENALSIVVNDVIGNAATIPQQSTAANVNANSQNTTDMQANDTKKAEAQDSTKSEAVTKPAVKTDNAVETKGTSTTQNQKFSMPVIGEVTFNFAQDRLVYSKTLEEWRTHSGIDLASDRGTPVKIVADGVISEVKSDPRWGITIIVEHKNGLKTVYSNLASDEMVSPNQKVVQGEIIGCVGDTAVFESVEQSHLHFEVWKNNEPVDPGSYLPK